MAKFRKKPVVIEAWRNFDKVTDRNTMPEWLLEALHNGDVRCSGGLAPYFTIKTLEGEMRADFLDWIIQGVKGELYPCKHDIFLATYEAVS